MTDTERLLSLHAEIESLIKQLNDRFAQYSTLLHTSLAEQVQTEIKEQEAEDSEVVEQTEAATEAIERGERIERGEAKAAAQAIDETRTEPNTRLLKAFTLNDKFRFRRELFGGNDADFTDTLALLADMDSYAEAEEYLIHDLMWNPNDENVAAFLSIIKENID